MSQSFRKRFTFYANRNNLRHLPYSHKKFNVNLISGYWDGSAAIFGRGGVGVITYINHIGMCRPKGYSIYGIWAFLV